MQSFVRSSRWLAVTLSSEALIKSISFSAEDFLGYAPQELFNQPITRILADDSAFEVPHILDAAGKWGHWEGGLVYRSRMGGLIEVRGAVSLLANGESDAAGYLLISSLDKSLTPSVDKDSALVEISTDLRVIAHDLNNPLAVMMGFTQLLTMNAACPAKIRKDIERVYSELKRVIEIVERLHGYAISLCKKAQQDQAKLRIAEPIMPARTAASPSAANSLPEY
jgi:signal transduction histidine kinase